MSGATTGGAHSGAHARAYDGDPKGAQLAADVVALHALSSAQGLARGALTGGRAGGAIGGRAAAASPTTGTSSSSQPITFCEYCACPLGSSDGFFCDEMNCEASVCVKCHPDPDVEFYCKHHQALRGLRSGS
jgi:hypothetical protein